MEQLNLGNEGVKSSRRRLSSILKAPRTSMKVPGAEQEEQQCVFMKEEVTKPIEKKRNSRRVSFAARNDVLVFSNDAKRESPVLASIQNTVVGDCRQDEKILHFAEEGSQQIKGLDTLLNNPLYVSQHLSKENFFSDPVLQDDRTMLLGEDTGYMDMTHSHTVTIDKDYEVDDVNPDIGLKVAPKISGDQNGLSCDAKVETKNVTMDSDFNAFLASISLPAVKDIVSSSSNKELGRFVCSANMSASEIDKENHLPPFLMKQVQHPISKGNPQQPRGLQRRRSRVVFLQDDDMEATTSHTVVIENKGNAQPVLSFVSGNNGSIVQIPALSNDDDMELTQSKTADINVKLTGNISCNIHSAPDHNRSHNFSENDDAMEMTGAFDVSPREKEHAIIMKEEAPISKVSKMSSFNVAGSGGIMDRNIPGNFQSNLSVAHTTNADDMEMTEALDVSVQEHTASMKEQTLFLLPKISKKSSFIVTGNGEMMDRETSVKLSIAQTANFDDMEMTRCQTIVLESKQFNGDKPLSNSRKSLPHASISSSVQNIEHIASMKRESVLQIHRPRKMSSINVIRNEEIMDHNKSGNLSIAKTANSDDMELTEALEVSVQEKEYTVSMKEKPLLPFSQISKKSSFSVIAGEEIINHNKSGNLSIAQTANSDDMEMTRCQTIVLEAKPFSEDKPLSNSRKSLPHALASEATNGDGMDMTQAFTGRIILNSHSASKKGQGQSILMPAMPTSSKSDCMDITGEPSTFASPSPDDMELTGCTTVNIDSNHTWLVSAADITSTRRAQSSANQTIIVAEPMEMTEVHMLPISERKAFMTRRKSMKSGTGMMSFCDPKNIEADNSQANFSNPDDMEMTQCQTIVLEAENYVRGKPSGKARKSLNLVTASSRPDVDCMEMTQALTGNIMFKSLICTEGNLLPRAQNHQIQDKSDCREPTCQASASGLSVPCVEDEMEFTGCNTIAIDAQSTLASSATNIKANESALWASTSLSRCTVSSGEQNEVPEAANSGINQEVFHSKHVPFTLKLGLNDTNLKHSNAETKSYVTAGMQVDKNYEKACPSDVMTTESVDEDNNMQVAKVITMPIETQSSVSFKQTEVENKETFSDPRNEENLVEGPWPKNEQSTNSVQLELSSTESVADSFIKEELQHAKSRRRSLADFQKELQNMSRRINEKQEVLRGSTTAPLPSCSLPDISLNGEERCETATSAEPASNVTPNVKQKDTSFKDQKTTPFSLKKKPFSSRISLCGIVPKLPKRATAITPNKTVTISTHSLQSFPLEKQLDNVVEQSSNCEAVNINDEEFPEMSSEEDLSGSLENWPINKEGERVDSSAVLINEEPLENDVFEPDLNMSQGLKRPYLEENDVTAEPTKKAFISDVGPGCHEAGVQWEGNFTSHAVENPCAKTIEDTAVSQSSLRYSQIDSHMDGTMDHEFDFNKKIEDGSITVNEFLSHFGINFVIHRSRPSALPDSCRAGETRTMEDLLKEKYIYHPKQRVYERDCKELTDIVERLKERIPEQEKSLRCINGALQQEIYTLSKEQLKSFGSKLKAQRVYLGKRSKALSHEMKGVLYSELIKTTQDAKQQLMAKIKETDKMMEELDGCITDVETELAAIDAVIMGNHHNTPQTRPDLKAKEKDLHKLNSAVTETEREIGELQMELRSLESQQEKLGAECSGLKSHLATLKSLNEWHLDETDERGALFTFLHNTVHLQVKLQTPAGKHWMTEDVQRNMDVSFCLQLDVEKSECHASMVHKLLALYNQSQTHWMQRYPTTQHIPELLHNVSLVVGRLRLLGEEIHRLKKWGGLRLCIRQITCVDTQIHLIFSSLKAFEKFELSLMVTPDYPFGPLQIQDFRNHIGDIRLSQIKDIVSSVKPGKNYLTNVLKNIHDDLLR